MAAKEMIRLRTEITPGFTLLELTIVLVVMAILLGLAVPSYRHYVQRSERADAIRVLLQVADCQERIRVNTGLYDTTQCMDGLGTRAYSFQLNPAGETSSQAFEVNALPVSVEGNHCGTLGLDHTGSRSISSGEGSLSSCWGGR
jgi:type IV pilus assembly protein PilE